MDEDIVEEDTRKAVDEGEGYNIVPVGTSFRLNARACYDFHWGSWGIWAPRRRGDGGVYRGGMEGNIGVYRGGELMLTNRSTYLYACATSTDCIPLLTEVGASSRKKSTQFFLTLLLRIIK